MSQQRATVVGLVGVELAPLRRCLERGSRAWCLVEGVLMDKQILENNIKGLKKARDACRSQLDIGAMKELEDAISKLEQLRPSSKRGRSSTAQAAHSPGHRGGRRYRDEHPRLAMRPSWAPQAHS